MALVLCFSTQETKVTSSGSCVPALRFISTFSHLNVREHWLCLRHCAFLPPAYRFCRTSVFSLSLRTFVCILILSTLSCSFCYLCMKLLRPVASIRAAVLRFGQSGLSHQRTSSCRLRCFDHGTQGVQCSVLIVLRSCGLLPQSAIASCVCVLTLSKLSLYLCLPLTE